MNIIINLFASKIHSRQYFRNGGCCFMATQQDIVGLLGDLNFLAFLHRRYYSTSSNYSFRCVCEIRMGLGQTQGADKSHSQNFLHIFSNKVSDLKLFSSATITSKLTVMHIFFIFPGAPPSPPSQDSPGWIRQCQKWQCGSPGFRQRGRRASYSCRAATAINQPTTNNPRS